MATKMSNGQLYKILNNAKKYNTPDVFIALVHISAEVKDSDKKVHFIIQIGNDKRNYLVRILSKHLTICKQTINNCLDEIIDLGLLTYNEDLSSWELMNMIDMLHEGFTNLRDVLLNDEFSTYKLREKKLLLYMCHLFDTKGGETFNNIHGTDFVINLKNKHSDWIKILNTKSPYYARTVISKFLNKISDKIEDLTSVKREHDFRPKEISDFIFYYNAPKLRQKYENDNWIKLKYIKELDMINKYVNFAGVTLTKHKKFQLAHSIGTLSSWVIKEYVCRCIINKYKAIQIYNSREDIKSLPAYTAAIIKEVVSNYKKYIETNKLISDVEENLKFAS